MTIHLQSEYHFQERGLLYKLNDNLELNLDNTIFFLKGDNGMGKTTFIEKILIPELQKKNLDFTYLSQDSEIQQYTIKASLAITGKSRINVDFISLYNRWFDKMKTSNILINDEFDKYAENRQKRFVFSLTHNFIKCYFIISHLNSNYIAPDIGTSFKMFSISFTLISNDSSKKIIRMSMVQNGIN